MTNSIKKINIIFDFDGVIINSHKIKTMAFYNIFKIHGEHIAQKAKKFHLENTGRSRYFKFKFIIKNILKSKISKNQIKILDENFDNYIEKKIKKLKPSQYLLKFLKNNQKKYNFFISTGTPQNKIRKILLDKKIFKFFNNVYGSPSLKIKHIQKIQKNNKKTIFIGDSFEDFKASKYTNTNFILKINSENINLRRKYNLNTINSFKYLEKKINFFL